MPFVQRKDGRVIGFAANPQPNWPKEFLADDHPDMLAYLANEEKEDLRSRRNALLTSSDWSQLPDAPLSAEKQAEWSAYRQALRDAPETGVIPDAPTKE